MKKVHLSIFLFLMMIAFVSCEDSNKEETSTLQEEAAKPNKVEKISVSALSSVPKLNLPKETIPKGTLVYAGEWNDADGKHIVTLSFINSKRDDRELDMTYETTQLYAHHFLLDSSTNSFKETWKIKEFITDCNFDLTAEFIGSSIRVSDENNNGVAEVWTMYKTACRSDVSPCSLKLIMYEGSQKHAMRGSMRIDDYDIHIGGEYKFDDAFKSSNPAVQQFAKELWMANREETFQ